MALLNNARGDARYGGEAAPLKVFDALKAALPDAAANIGNVIFVTDAVNAAGSPVTAGSLCYSNGVNWIDTTTGTTVV
jgi:hypothetical protein